MPETINGEELAGFKKKSFALPYNGGEIWFEHLDGLYGFEELVLKKLSRDSLVFSRPSSPAFACFVFDETDVTEEIINAVKRAICDGGKRFLKIAFVGLNRKSAHKLMKELSGNGFEMNFLGGLEDAKEWLLAK